MKHIAYIFFNIFYEAGVAEAQWQQAGRQAAGDL